jgi:hypothetical protein
MSQPHPPIPEPQPNPHPQPDAGTGSTAASAADLPASPPPAPGPRTNSILVPPSQQPAEPEPLPAVDPSPLAPPSPAAEWSPSAGPAPEPFRTAQFPAVRDEPSSDPYAGPPVTLPPVPGPSTAPVAGPEPHPQTSPVSAPTGEQSTPSQPGAAHRAGAKLAGVRRAAGGRTVLAGLGLGLLALVFLQIGLVLDDDLRSLWAEVPTWSAFATLAVLVAPVPLVAGLVGRRLPARTAWQVGAVGVAALAVFWVLVALPLVLSDRGFWLTAALGAAGAALWLAPGRTE